ncbi:hypothetical protein KUTeg_023824 [Tegillarca granosa]|uniref:Uncharacterized protein n=1 Tax=Tegillarca granosa TaxID=220873 RepID=A0ABQ9E2S4_TEGGR|nr:hypothetical protein KUTeg_023824 [Tegillarca granosa]
MQLTQPTHRRRNSLGSINEDNVIKIQTKSSGQVVNISEIVCATMISPDFTQKMIPKLSDDILKHILPDLKSAIDDAITTVLAPIMKAIQGHEKRLDTQDQALKEQDLKIKELESAVNAQDMTISNQNHEIRSLQESIKHLQLNQEEQDQYSRRNCLVFKNVPLNTDINSIDTDKVVLDICSKLGVQVDLQDISRSHTLGRSKNGKVSVITRFNSYRLRAEVYKNKKKLKKSPTQNFYYRTFNKTSFSIGSTTKQFEIGKED